MDELTEEEGKMVFVRSMLAASWMAIATMTVGCAREGEREWTAGVKETGEVTTVAATATVDESAQEVTLASSLVSDEADEYERARPIAEDGISLRDANLATWLIPRHFPVQDMFLTYSGALMSPYVGALQPYPSPESSTWMLSREDSNQSHTEVVFELKDARASEDDIPLHLDIDRVLYVHVHSCRNGDREVVPIDQFQIDRIGIFDLFRQCDEGALRDFQFSRRIEEVLAETIESQRAVYDRHGHRVSPPRESTDVDDGPTLSNEELEAELQRFIGRPLEEMIWELNMTTSSDAPILSNSNRRSGRWFWLSREYPDKYLEIEYEWRNERHYVREIQLRNASGEDTDAAHSERVAYRRFIGRPLDEMIGELELIGPCFGGVPRVVWGSPHGGTSFWVCPRGLDRYIEVIYKNEIDGKTVLRILLHDRENTE